MKTEAQIKEEISHQESEYDRHKKIADAHKNDDSSSWVFMKYQNHSEDDGKARLATTSPDVGYFVERGDVERSAVSTIVWFSLWESHNNTNINKINETLKILFNGSWLYDCGFVDIGQVVMRELGITYQQI